MLIDDYYVVIDVDPQEVIVQDEDPSRFLYHTTGSISGLDESDERIRMGRFGLYYVNAQGAERAGESLADVYDSNSSTLGYFETLYDIETEQISERVERLLERDIWYANVLILDRLEILPQFRGRGLGAEVIRTLIERFSPGTDLVAMKPFPLQLEANPRDQSEWRDDLQLDRLSRNEPRSTGKLRRYYATIGFKHMRGTPYMLLCPDMLTGDG